MTNCDYSSIVSRTFGVTCDVAMQAIIDQMNAWTGPDGCADGGEKCLYEVSRAGRSVCMRWVGWK